MADEYRIRRRRHPSSLSIIHFSFFIYYFSSFMKVYISLPITGKDLQEQKRHAEAVASFLLTAGFTPVNPFNNGLGDGAPYWEHIREDLKLLLGCGAIWLCKGWEASTGCVLERNVAAACGMASVTEAMPIGKAFDILKARERREGGEGK